MEVPQHDPPRVVVLDCDRRVIKTHELPCYEDVLDADECVMTISSLLESIGPEAARNFILIHDQHNTRWKNEWEIPSLHYDHTVFRMIPITQHVTDKLPEWDTTYLSNAARMMKRSWATHRKTDCFDEK